MFPFSTWVLVTRMSSLCKNSSSTFLLCMLYLIKKFVFNVKCYFFKWHSGRYSFFFSFLKKRKSENSNNSRSSCVAPEARAGLANAYSEPCDTSFSPQGATSYPSLAAVWPSWVPTCWWHSHPTVMRRWQAITSSGTSWAGLFSCTWYEKFRSFHLGWWV